MTYSTRSLLWFVAIAAVVLSAIDVFDRCIVRHKEHYLRLEQMGYQLLDVSQRLESVEVKVEALERNHVDRQDVQALQDQVGGLLDR